MSPEIMRYIWQHSEYVEATAAAAASVFAAVLYGLWYAEHLRRVRR